MKNYFLLFLFIILLGCKSIKPKELAVIENNPILLPALEPEADIDNLRRQISSGDFEKPEGTESDKPSSNLITLDEELIIQKRINDILKIFGSEVKKNINNRNSLPYGKILLELLDFKGRENKPLLFFSLWTLCGPTILGFPFTYIKTELTCQVSILDSQNKLIGKYIANGKGTTFIAMYWGYGKDAWRKSNMIAFKKAMVSIKNQMRNDSQLLTEKLITVKK